LSPCTVGFGDLDEPGIRPEKALRIGSEHRATVTPSALYKNRISGRFFASMVTGAAVTLHPPETKQRFGEGSLGAGAIPNAVCQPIPCVGPVHDLYTD
jgi:hypothetical protein